jgi:hypothetical protein
MSSHLKTFPGSRAEHLEGNGSNVAIGEDSDRRCVDCNAVPPKTHTNYTLISAEHGWRLTLEAGPDGRKVPKWRCPRCWDKRREQSKGRGKAGGPGVQRGGSQK